MNNTYQIYVINNLKEKSIVVKDISFKTAESVADKLQKFNTKNVYGVEVYTNDDKTLAK